MSAELKMDTSEIGNALDDIAPRVLAAVLKYAETGAAKVESYAKKNAKWQDRTGDARRRLKGDVTSSGDVVKIRLAHGVDYGKFLELAYERRYAIIEESLNSEGPEIMAGFNRLMERVGK